MYDIAYDEVLALLLPLERVTQSRRYHPEGNALFHSLQVYGRARDGSDDPVLGAAALRLADLEVLREWDLAGRRLAASVVGVERAVGEILEPGVAEHWLCGVASVEDAWS